MFAIEKTMKRYISEVLVVAAASAKYKGSR
jgi:hypothetical protein